MQYSRNVDKLFFAIFQMIEFHLTHQINLLTPQWCRKGGKAVWNISESYFNQKENWAIVFKKIKPVLGPKYKENQMRIKNLMYAWEFRV